MISAAIHTWKSDIESLCSERFKVFAFNGLNLNVPKSKKKTLKKTQKIPTKIPKLNKIPQIKHKL